MIVTCGECQTSYNLDASLIKGERAKVRCSRCQHLFWVSPDGTVTEIAPEAPEIQAPPEISPEAEVTPAEEVSAGEEELPASPKVVAREVLAPAPEPSPSVEPESASPPAEPEPQPEAVAPAAPEPARVSSWFGRLFSEGWATIIWAVVLGCLAGLVLGGMSWWYFHHRRAAKPVASPVAQAPAARPEAPAVPAPPPTDPKDLKDIVISPPEARYHGLVNSQGGQLLVIQGEVKNNSPQPRGPIQLKAILTDSQNKPLREQLFYTGTTFANKELQQLTPEEISRWLNTPGGRTQKPVVGPGEKQPFNAVFFQAPENLAGGGYGYLLEVVQGPPAASP
ncbi:MAG: DUF3426 domain-containing protein [Thermodesulfobacteriota bacterium]